MLFPLSRISKFFAVATVLCSVSACAASATESDDGNEASVESAASSSPHSVLTQPVVWVAAANTRTLGVGTLRQISFDQAAYAANDVLGQVVFANGNYQTCRVFAQCPRGSYEGTVDRYRKGTFSLLGSTLTMDGRSMTVTVVSEGRVRIGDIEYVAVFPRLPEGNAGKDRFRFYLPDENGNPIEATHSMNVCATDEACPELRYRSRSGAWNVGRQTCFKATSGSFSALSGRCGVKVASAMDLQQPEPSAPFRMPGYPFPR